MECKLYSEIFVLFRRCQNASLSKKQHRNGARRAELSTSVVFSSCHSAAGKKGRTFPVAESSVLFQLRQQRTRHVVGASGGDIAKPPD